MCKLCKFRENHTKRGIYIPYFGEISVRPADVVQWVSHLDATCGRAWR